ncbi:MAG TPA: hypothetical protein VMB21_08145 [Candidatus Limnocylindria bacterium]|nr:hypothetical protein [Candidatus Limnocylindria bacterium]
MNRLQSIGRLLGALLVGGAVFAVCYWGAAQARLAVEGRASDELAWLAHEFKLTDAEVARIRPLHAAYLPKCEAMCARLAAKNRELAEVLRGATNVPPEAERKLAEAAALRAECQAQMLRYFQEVARAMPPESGARYLAEMQRLTFGLPGRLEDAMTHPAHEHP